MARVTRQTSQTSDLVDDCIVCHAHLTELIDCEMIGTRITDMNSCVPANMNCWKCLRAILLSIKHHDMSRGLNF
jgi:hypothetical protein